MVLSLATPVGLTPIVEPPSWLVLLVTWGKITAIFEQVMRAGFSQKGKAHGAKCTSARDQALLWVLFDTGMTVSEVCAVTSKLGQTVAKFWVKLRKSA